MFKASEAISYDWTNVFRCAYYYFNILTWQTLHVLCCLSFLSFLVKVISLCSSWCFLSDFLLYFLLQLYCINQWSDIFYIRTYTYISLTLWKLIAETSLRAGFTKYFPCLFNFKSLQYPSKGSVGKCRCSCLVHLLHLGDITAVRSPTTNQPIVTETPAYSI